jgi:hypothetical protein
MTRDKSQEKRKKRDKAIDTPDGRQEAEDKNAELGTQICCYSALQHRDGILNFKGAQESNRSKESIPSAYVVWRAGTTILFLPIS